MKPDGVGPRKFRFLHLGAAVGGGLAAIMLGLWLARVPIVGWVIVQAIERSGLGPGRVEIIALGPSRTTLRLPQSALGTIDSAELEYRFDRGLGLAFKRIRISNARIRFDWRDGRLRPIIASRGGPFALPAARIEIVDSSLTLKTATAEIGAEFSGTLTRGKRPDLFDATFTFKQIGFGANALGAGRLTASLQHSQALSVSLDSAPVRVALRADGSRVAHGVPFTVDGTASADFLGRLTGAYTADTGDIGVQVSGVTPPLSSLRDALLLPLDAWLRTGAADGEIRGAVTAFAIPGIATAASASAALHLSLRDGALIGTTSKGVAVSGVEMAAPFTLSGTVIDRISQLNITATDRAPLFAIAQNDASGSVQIAASVALEAPRLSLHGPFVANATFDSSRSSAPARHGPASGQFNLHGSAALTLPPRHSMPALELVLDGTYTIDPATLQFAATHGTLTLVNPRWGDTLNFPGTVRAALRPGAIVTKDRQGGALRASASLQPFKWNALIKRRDADPVTLLLSGRRLTFAMDHTGQKIVLAQGAVELPARGVAARGITGTFAVGAATSVQLNVEELLSTSEPALFTPLRVALDARFVADDITFSATLRDATQRLRVSAKGRHHRDTGQGRASFTLAPVDLARKGNEMALSPVMAARIDPVAGTIAGQGALHWGARAPPDSLALILKDVALTHADFAASNLNGALKLDSLKPLRSPPGQTISGVFEFPSVKRVPLTLTFKIEPDKLLLEHGRAEIFGGVFETTGAEIEVATGAGRADLKISNLDLESAFTVLNLKKLRGSGRLSGVLPLRFARGRIAVDKGRLEASSPGIVRIGVEALADQLKSYGENVDLAFRALTDFHYERLAIEADKPLLGAGTAMFRLEGNNPAVMDGQPFIFNIRLETDFDYLAKILLELSSAAHRALGRKMQEDLAP